MNWLKKILIRWLLSDLDLRLKDIERHFVTKRDEHGKAVETLADIPVDRRKDLIKPSLAGMSPQQRRAWMEATDGGRNLA